MEKKSSGNAPSQKTCTCSGIGTNESKRAFEDQNWGERRGTGTSEKHFIQPLRYTRNCAAESLWWKEKTEEKKPHHLCAVHLKIQ